MISIFFVLCRWFFFACWFYSCPKKEWTMLQKKHITTPGFPPFGVISRSLGEFWVSKLLSLSGKTLISIFSFILVVYFFVSLWSPPSQKTRVFCFHPKMKIASCASSTKIQRYKGAQNQCRDATFFNPSDRNLAHLSAPQNPQAYNFWKVLFGGMISKRMSIVC